MIDSVDVWILEQPTVISKRKKALYPVVLQRQQLADALARYLSMLGLERRAKTISLVDRLAKDDTSDHIPDTKPANTNGCAQQSCPCQSSVAAMLLLRQSIPFCQA